MRRPIIVGNWKMNLTVNESIRLITALKNLLSGKQEVDVAVAPSSIALNTVCIALQDVQISVAAQNMDWRDKGAFTGEVSATMVTEVGCDYVLVGHSERRQHFGETDETVHLKVKAAGEHDLIPVVCVGESASQRDSNETMGVVEHQIMTAFRGTSFNDGSDFVVAYEPVWAIGTGKNPTPEEAQEVHAHIRRLLTNIFRSDIAEKVRILYGGSVTAEIAKNMVGQPDVDGFIVGGASCDAKDFADIVATHELQS